MWVCAALRCAALRCAALCCALLCCAVLARDPFAGICHTATKAVLDDRLTELRKAHACSVHDSDLIEGASCSCAWHLLT